VKKGAGAVSKIVAKGPIVRVCSKRSPGNKRPQCRRDRACSSAVWLGVGSGGPGAIFGGRVATAASANRHRDWRFFRRAGPLRNPRSALLSGTPPRARPVVGSEGPGPTGISTRRLYNVVEEMALAAGIPDPCRST